MDTIKVTVSQLQPGDYLTGSKTTILEVSDSCRCPVGKLNVRVRYENGKESVRQWNKRTSMKITRGDK